MKMNKKNKLLKVLLVILFLGLYGFITSLSGAFLDIRLPIIPK